MRSFVILVINAGSGQDQTIRELGELIARVGLDDLSVLSETFGPAK
jgi:hypothetical protein